MIFYILMNLVQASIHFNLYMSVFHNNGIEKQVLVLTVKRQFVSDVVGHVLVEEYHGRTLRFDFELETIKVNCLNIMKDIKAGCPNSNDIEDVGMLCVAYFPEAYDIRGKEIKLKLFVSEVINSKLLAICIKEDAKPIQLLKSFSIFVPNYFKEIVKNHLNDMRASMEFINEFYGLASDVRVDRVIKKAGNDVREFLFSCSDICAKLNILNTWIVSKLDNETEFSGYLRSSDYSEKMKLFNTTCRDASCFLKRFKAYYMITRKKLGRSRCIKYGFKFLGFSEPSLSNRRSRRNIRKFPYNCKRDFVKQKYRKKKSTKNKGTSLSVFISRFLKQREALTNEEFMTKEENNGCNMDLKRKLSRIFSVDADKKNPEPKEFIFYDRDIKEESVDYQESEYFSEICEESGNSGGGERRNEKSNDNETSFQYFEEWSFYKKISIILFVFFTLLVSKKFIDRFVKHATF
ncbi:hypothetical protein P3W45_001663 [Vairimorpha bombi]|jgi:hypothetical protein